MFCVSFANIDCSYDAAKDPWMMDNLYNSTKPDMIAAMHKALHVFASCAGDACP
jgi:hypothetical protein